MTEAPQEYVDRILAGVKTPEDRAAVLERRLLESVRVNVGLIAENASLKKQVGRVDPAREVILLEWLREYAGGTENCPACDSGGFGHERNCPLVALLSLRTEAPD